MTGDPYSFVSNEFKMLLRGEFGRTPVPPDAELMNRVLGPDDEPLIYRPAAYLMPVLEDDDILPFIHSQKDRLLHHMLGEAADAFLKNRAVKDGERLEKVIEDVIVGI
jgi:pyruvate/oxaloacetate carboxyltransferase